MEMFDAKRKKMKYKLTFSKLKLVKMKLYSGKSFELKKTFFTFVFKNFKKILIFLKKTLLLILQFEYAYNFVLRF